MQEPEFTEPEPDVKARNPQEIDAFLAAINQRSEAGTRFYCLALLTSMTGMRIGEVLNVRVRDIDTIAGTVFVRKSKTKKQRTCLLPAEPEARNEFHTALMRWLNLREKWNPTSDRLFVSKTGAPLAYPSVVRTFHSTSRQAKVEPDITPHQMRHSYVSRMMGHGANTPGLARQMGHSIPVLLKTYTHCVDGEQLRAVEKW